MSQHYQTPKNISQLNKELKVWTSAVFLAEAERDGFADIEIITSDAYKKEQAADLAGDKGGDIRTVQRNATKFEHLMGISEFVEIFPDRIRVCLDVDVIDDHVVNEVISIISSIDDLTPGSKVLLSDIQNTTSQ